MHINPESLGQETKARREVPFSVQEILIKEIKLGIQENERKFGLEAFF